LLDKGKVSSYLFVSNLRLHISALMAAALATAENIAFYLSTIRPTNFQRKKKEVLLV
jgi:hypothetical protein